MVFRQHKLIKSKQEISWQYIHDLTKLIKSKDRRSKMRLLLINFKPELVQQPASVRHHHNQIGGLIGHTEQVLRKSLELYDEYKQHLPHIRRESVYICAVLHDLSKTQHYKRRATDILGLVPIHPFEYNKSWKFEHDIWTLSQASKFGLQLNYDEMMGIMQAHGGWSKLDDPINKLAVIIHCADLLSSQLIKKSEGYNG